MPAGRRIPEIMIKAHDSMDIRAGEVQRLRQQGYRLLWYMTEGFLQGMQYWQSRPF